MADCVGLAESVTDAVEDSEAVALAVSLGDCEGDVLEDGDCEAVKEGVGVEVLLADGRRLCVCDRLVDRVFDWLPVRERV